MSDLADALRSARGAIEDVWTVIADLDADTYDASGVSGHVDEAEQSIDAALKKTRSTP